jgi:hypothetical protein
MSVEKTLHVTIVVSTRSTLLEDDGSVVPAVLTVNGLPHSLHMGTTPYHIHSFFQT